MISSPRPCNLIHCDLKYKTDSKSALLLRDMCNMATDQWQSVGVLYVIQSFLTLLLKMFINSIEKTTMSTCILWSEKY